MKTISFYTLPLHPAKYGSWVYDAKSNFVFQFDGALNTFDRNTDSGFTEEVSEMRKKILDSLNSDTHEPIKELDLTVNPGDLNEIFNKGELIITIRGWGNLTGTGANNFSEEKAAKIQDDFRDWILYKLNK